MSIIQKLINIRAGLKDNFKVSYYLELHGYYLVNIKTNDDKRGYPIFSIRFKDDKTAKLFATTHIKNKSEFDIIVEDGELFLAPRYAYAQLVIECVNEDIAKKLVKHFRRQYDKYKKSIQPNQQFSVITEQK